jgi:hypothetical protein
MQNNLVQGGSISLPLTLRPRRLGFRELLTTETIALPFDYGCIIVKSSQVHAKREELKCLLRATIAAYDLAIPEPAVAKKAARRKLWSSKSKRLPWKPAPILSSASLPSVS